LSYQSSLWLLLANWFPAVPREPHSGRETR
jgi:hypothetical protein